MNHEEIICMALNDYGIYSFNLKSMGELIAAIRAEEREKVARWMINQGYSTGHGDSMDDLLRELGREMTEGRL